MSEDLARGDEIIETGDDVVLRWMDVGLFSAENKAAERPVVGEEWRRMGGGEEREAVVAAAVEDQTTSLSSKSSSCVFSL